jgi:serine/threonine-protein kinase RsbW/stage II sporulation protein AB (anti-sigma F factor)
MSDFRSPESSEAAPRNARPPPAAATSSEVLVYECIVPAVPASIRRIRCGLDEALRMLGVDGGRRTDIALALTEAVSNAVLHAYLDSRPGPVYVAAGVSERRLCVTVSDCGRGMIPRTDSPGLGVGLSLIRKVSDGVTIGPSGSEAGTCVAMSFRGVTPPASDPPAAIVPTRVLAEYRDLLKTFGALQSDTRALLAEARQAVAKARRLQEARRRGD